jgi:hypothetical protein
MAVPAENERESSESFGKAMKVYCNNCKYRGFSGSVLCTYEDRFVATREFLRPKAAKNRNGKCVHYERLWWKFWVQEATMNAEGEKHEPEKIHHPPFQ